MFLDRSKINHILADLGPPGSKCVDWTSLKKIGERKEKRWKRGKEIQKISVSHEMS